jgi:hypothetical protein
VKTPHATIKDSSVIGRWIFKQLTDSFAKIVSIYHSVRFPGISSSVFFFRFLAPMVNNKFKNAYPLFSSFIPYGFNNLTAPTAIKAPITTRPKLKTKFPPLKILNFFRLSIVIYRRII